MSVESPGWASQNSTFGAEQTRRAIGSLLRRGSTVGSIAGGLVGPTDCQVTAGTGMHVLVSAGETWIPGTSSSTQGGYYGRVSSTETLTITASDPANPRIDTICLTEVDKAYAGSADSLSTTVATGTPTSGASLSNLSGASASPASSLVLAYVLVPAGSSSVTNANIANVAAPVQLNPYGLLATVNASSNIAASCGEFVNCVVGTAITVTLPAPVTGAIVGVSASSIQVNPVTVQYGTGGGKIFGEGLGGSGASSFTLGSPNSSVLLICPDGSNWNIIAGAQDTGWVNLTPASGFSLTITNGSATPGGTGSYRVRGNEVRLAGRLQCNLGGGSSGGTLGTVLATLPAIATPANYQLLNAGAVDAAQSAITYIDTSGNIRTNQSLGSLAVYRFEGITYSLS